MTTPVSTTQGQRPMTYLEHGWEKCKQQPFVPIGAVATTVALLGATASLRSGNRQSFQTFLRLRVVAQGATVLAMVAGAYSIFTGEKKASVPMTTAVIAPPTPTPAPLVVSETTAPNDEIAYPPRMRTKVSDFTRRQREAREAQVETKTE